MNDLISRQAAIEALDFEIVHMTAYCDGKNEGNPLAQYNKGLEDGKKAIEALPSAQPVQWISVKDRLPDSGTGVLVFTDDYCAYTAHYDGYWWLSGEPTLSYNVTHWMPLPAPPEEAKDGTE